MTPLHARLLALPSLRRQAEEEARELFAHGHAVAAKYGFESPLWELLRHEERAAIVENHARGLADFTRWQSQAWAARRIGELLGWKMGDEVPQIGCTAIATGIVWWITKHGRSYNFVNLPDFPTDRTEALATILLHLESTRAR